jgi:hypothetical protein
MVCCVVVGVRQRAQVVFCMQKCGLAAEGCQKEQDLLPRHAGRGSTVSTRACYIMRALSWRLGLHAADVATMKEVVDAGVVPWRPYCGAVFLFLALPWYHLDDCPRLVVIHTSPP